MGSSEYAMLIRPNSLASQTLLPPSARPESPESRPENMPPAAPAAKGLEPILILRVSEVGSSMESSIIPSTMAPSELPAR